ncbi:MAG: adenine deaminase, partial [Deinococcota bacterium]
MTQDLAAVAAGRQPADMVITGARLLSTYTERLLKDKELWLYKGRIAAVKPTGTYKTIDGNPTVYDAAGGILAPGLVDP